MLFMMYHKSTRPTGRTIAKAMGLRKFGVRPPEGNIDMIVRWGSSREARAEVEINAADSIATAANKRNTLQCLQDAGISVVPFGTYDELVEAYDPGVIFGRRCYGSKGRDIEILMRGQRPDPANRSQFFTKYIQAAREFRLHVVGDQVFRVQGKYCDFPDLRGHGMIHNYDHGYRFRAPRQQLRPERINAAIEAVKALGLDFGAVDMILDEDGRQYILEVNTGPSCSPLTARGYVAQLADLINVRSNGAYQPMPQFERLEGLALDPDEAAVPVGL